MKKFSKITVIILSLIFFVLSLPVSASAENDNRFGRQILSGMSNSSSLLTVYDELKVGFENVVDSVSLSANVDPDELNTVVSALTNDYPEFFWITGGYSYSQNASEQITAVVPEYHFQRSKIASAKDALDSMASRLIEGLEGKSDYEKALTLYDRLAERVVYVKTENDQTAYGAIVEGEAVCAGYARAYHYLLQKVGIQAWSIEGESINPATNTKEGHRWNLVKLDGKWYYSDVTWGDQPGTTYHNYFNRTLSYFNNTHFPSAFEDYLPDDNSTELDYFKKNNLIFKTVDADRIANILKKNNNVANLYIDGDVKEFLDNLSGKMEKIVLSLGAKGGASYSFTTSNLGNEIILTVIIEQKGHVHSLKQVDGIPATCYQTGTLDYYKCSCGRIFSDSEGKNEISSPDSLVSEKLPHTPSDELRSNQTAHWKYCTVCNADIEGSASLHTDEDENLVCEVCSFESSEPFETSEGNSDLLDKEGFSLPPYVLYGGAGLLIILVLGFIFKKR